MFLFVWNALSLSAILVHLLNSTRLTSNLTSSADELIKQTIMEAVGVQHDWIEGKPFETLAVPLKPWRVCYGEGVEGQTGMVAPHVL